MAEFKVGDFVERIKLNNDFIRIGDVRKVTKVKGRWLQLDGVVSKHFNATCFKLASPTALLDKWLEENPA